MVVKKHGLSRLVNTNRKMALLTSSQECELAMAKSTGTPTKC